MKKIMQITIKTITDEDPDTSYMGKYTNDLEPGVIVRRYNKFYEKLPEDAEIPKRGRECRGFRPYAGGEKVGTRNYYKYGMQGYKRMEALQRGDWRFIGIWAEAVVATSHDGGVDWLHQDLTSRGLWGIESNSDPSYFEEIRDEQLAELKAILLDFGFTEEEITTAIENTNTEE